MNALSDGINYKCNVCVTHSTTMYMECVYDTLHCTILHCTALHCTALNYTFLYFTTMYCSTLHTLYCTVLSCVCLSSSKLEYTLLTNFTDLHTFQLYLLPLLCAPVSSTYYFIYYLAIFS